MKKFTPGPYEIVQVGGAYLLMAKNKAGVPEAVAAVVGLDGDAKANAHLLGAAPDMLAALKEVFKMLEDVRTGKVERGVNFYLADAQATILDAIAKAEGK